MDSQISRETSAGDATKSPITLLTDDILVEIFLRLPYASTLLHCALADKRHLRLISDPTFLRRFRRLHPVHQLLGCFLNVDKNLHMHPTNFFPLRHLDRDLAVPRRMKLPFYSPGEDSIYCMGWSAKDSNNGLLLLSNPDAKRLLVADPLDPGRSASVPWPSPRFIRRSDGRLGFYLLGPEEEYNGPWQSSFRFRFRVLCINRCEIRAAVFSSASGSWKDLILEDHHLYSWSCGFGFVMRANGNLYWRSRCELLMLDTSSMQFKTLKTLSVMYCQNKSFMVGETADCEVCVGVVTEFVFRLWVCKKGSHGKDDDVKWVLEKEVKLIKLFSCEDEKMYKTFSKQVYRSCNCNILAINAGLVLLRWWPYSRSYCYFTLQLKTMQLEKVFHRGFVSKEYLYAMPWPPSFPNNWRNKSLT